MLKDKNGHSKDCYKLLEGRHTLLLQKQLTFKAPKTSSSNAKSNLSSTQISVFAGSLKLLADRNFGCAKHFRQYCVVPAHFTKASTCTYNITLYTRWKIYLRLLRRKGWHLVGRREAEVVGIEAVVEVPREVGGVVVEVSH